VLDYAVTTRQSWIAYFARAVHSPSFFPADNAFSMGEENPFPAIGDAAYRKRVEGGPSHGLTGITQDARKCKDRACGSGDSGQTDRHAAFLGS